LHRPFGRRLGAVLVVLGLCVSSPAFAETKTVEGRILSLDHGELVVDLGRHEGVVEGSAAMLYRPVAVRHPVTGKILRERFLIGTVSFLQVQGTLSLVVPAGAPTRTPEVGDIVVFSLDETVAPATSGRALPAPKRTTKPRSAVPSRAEPTEAESPTAPTAPTEGGGVEPAAALAAAQPAKVDGGSPATTTSARAPAPERPAPKPTVAFALPARAEVGVPLALAVNAFDVKTVTAHVQAVEGGAYESFPLAADGRGYFRGTLPAKVMVGPRLGLFLEGTDVRDQPTPLVGTASAPRPISVETPTGDASALAAATVSASLFGEYAAYDVPQKNDHAFQTEGSFGLRLGEGQLRAIRSGFGVYRGVGGTLYELDTLGLRGRPVGLTYGWLEAEWAPWSTTSLIGRVVSGVGRDGVTGGGQAFVRVGHDQHTNLLIGGEVLGGIGIRGVAELSLKTLDRIPLSLRTEITNQPAGLAPRDDADGTSQGPSDIGARAIVQAGYRVSPALVVFGRASYQGRTIHHAGPGAGAGVTYEWLPHSFDPTFLLVSTLSVVSRAVVGGARSLLRSEPRWCWRRRWQGPSPRRPRRPLRPRHPSRPPPRSCNMRRCSSPQRRPRWC
jgi:hypothetical protein